MPLIQGGPPQWIWERTPSVLKWEVVPSQDGRPSYELRVNCGLEIVRLHFFTEDELRGLHSRIGEVLGDRLAVHDGR